MEIHWWFQRGDAQERRADVLPEEGSTVPGRRQHGGQGVGRTTVEIPAAAYQAERCMCQSRLL